MNERIRLFAEQAQPDPVAYRVEHFQGSVGYWDKNEPVWKSGLYQESKEHFTCKPLYTQEDLEKFAELIVRECIDITSGLSKLFPRTDVSFDVGYTMGTTRATKEIQEHFGVEE